LKKALILTYYWPPGSGPGVQRWLKFSKYLPKFEIQPTVITVKDGSYPSADASPLDDIPNDLTIHHTKTVEPFAIYNALRGKKGNSVEVGMGNLKGKPSFLSKVANYVRANYFIPDARKGWNSFAYKKALEVIDNDKPDCIITTGPPHSTHLVGERLKRETGIPWIADMRDPWTTIYYNAFLNRTEKTKKKDKALEDLVLSKASAVVVASAAMKDEFSDRSKNISFIPNGYDDEDFQNLKQIERDKFILAYAGNLKSNQNCSALWTALKELSENADFKANFRLEVTGNVDEGIIIEWENLGLKELIDVSPFVPHKQSIEIMHSAHMLLLPIPKSENNKGIITGKIFEYLASRRPILSIGPKDGNAAEILSMCGKETMLDYSDKIGMRTMISSAYDGYKSGNLSRVTGNEIYRNYSRLGCTEQLSNVINQTVH
jgi:glycosyltransferase involved in cell wall biosynthesis